MPRPPRTGVNTVASFILPDDTAIGEGVEYGEYLNTFDESILKLEGTPDRYYFSGMDSLVGNLAASVLQQTQELYEEDEEGIFKLKEEFAKLSVRDLRQVKKESVLSNEEAYKEIIGKCLKGVDSFPYLKAPGVVEEYKWPVGTKCPDGLVDALLEDSIFKINFLLALFNLSNLTEDEKKP